MKSIIEEILYQKRSAMNKRQREQSYKTALPRMLNPHAIEKRYANQIREWLKEVIQYTSSFITPEVLKEWVGELRGDSEKTSDWENTLDSYLRGDSEEEEEVEGWLGSLNKVTLKRSLHAVFRKDAFSGAFTAIITGLKDLKKKMFEGSEGERKRFIVSGYGGKVSEFNQTQFQKIYNKILGMKYIVIEPWETEVINSWATNNYTLITSLSDEYIKKLNNLVSDGVLYGKSHTTIQKEIQSLNKNISKSRAKLIARDQVGSLQGMMTQRRMKDAGMIKYKWMTALDERVRQEDPRKRSKLNTYPSHRDMENSINKWEDDTVYSKDNGKSWKKRPAPMQGAIPGSQISCRCTAVPWMDEIYEDIDNQLKEE